MNYFSPKITFIRTSNNISNPILNNADGNREKNKWNFIQNSLSTAAKSAKIFGTINSIESEEFTSVAHVLCASTQPIYVYNAPRRYLYRNALTFSSFLNKFVRETSRKWRQVETIAWIKVTFRLHLSVKLFKNLPQHLSVLFPKFMRKWWSIIQSGILYSLF